MDHQAITDRYAQLDDAEDKLLQRHAKERESLRELCGSLGHKWGRNTRISVSANGVYAAYHICDVCGANDAPST